VVVGLFLDEAVDGLQGDAEWGWGRHFGGCGVQGQR
jgi:hypothetical protein